MVQIYVESEKSFFKRPVRELRAFKKVDLEAGETKTVELVLDQRAFACYHSEWKEWYVESGIYHICVGKNAAE